MQANGYPLCILLAGDIIMLNCIC